MIVVKNKKCKTPYCDTLVKTKFKGYCMFCFIHTFPDEPVTRNYKTKERAVVEYIIKHFPLSKFSWQIDSKITDGCSRRRPDLLLDMGDKVIIVEIDENEQLRKSMDKYGIDGVLLELHFPERYPFAPPFVRIVSPRFVYRTGHITINGAICHQILSAKKWKPVCRVESLLIDIRCNILEGEGDIDPVKSNIPYSFNEAKSDYTRVMAAHGWN